MEQSNNLQRLESWCAQQTLGQWDRGGAIRIETLGDPGWRVCIELRGSELEQRTFEEIRHLCPGAKWLHCRVRNGCFEGCGGPEMLETILSSFLDWAAVSESVAA